jgi:moderate conductance mechanosensitive channel
LFTAAFSLGARPLIADMFAGIGFIFADNFDVGEKIELPTAMGKIEGVVEGMTLQTTLIRVPSGELYTIPNADIRVLRNFSRGSYSTAHIKLKVATADLEKALAVLSELGNEVITLMPNLLGSWQIISETGVIGTHTELVLLTKTNFGQAGELRPRLLALVQTRLAEAGISLAD